MTVRLLMLCVAGCLIGGSTIASAQTVAIFDTAFAPPLLATMFVPAVSNGIGVVLVHGSGGGRGSQRPWCDTLAAYGYVGMSIDYVEGSQYPEEPRTAKLAVEFLRRNASRFGITTNQIVGWGMSRGAWIWGEAIPWDNADSVFGTDPAVNDHLDAAVLLYGFYDGTAIPYVSNITTPVLLIHGTADVVVPYVQSVELNDSLLAHGKVSQLLSFEGAPHAFDLNYPQATGFTLAGLVAKDTALAFLQRIVNPALRIRVSSSSIDCGNVLVHSSDTVMFRVDNIGTSDLILDSASIADPNLTLLGLPPFPAALPPRSSMEIRVVFHPATVGQYSDSIELTSNDPLHPSVKIAIRGRGRSAIARTRPGVLYAAGPGQTSGSISVITPATATTALVGDLGVPDVRGLTVRPATGELYGAATTAASSVLYRVSADSGFAVRVCHIPLGNIRGLAFSPADVLYCATAQGILCRIDQSSGDTAFIGRVPALAYSGLAFDPIGGGLWASVRTPIDSLFTLNTLTGAATFVGTTGFSALTTALAFDPRGTLYALIDNGSGEDYLATIDTRTGAGSLVTNNPLILHDLTAMAMATDTTVTAAPDPGGANLPYAFSLGQNYPDPFNPSTTISYCIPERGRVLLDVYDVLGREVARLVNGIEGPGEHTVRWDAAGKPSGVYFYRLLSGRMSETKKMLLTR